MHTRTEVEARRLKWREYRRKYREKNKNVAKRAQKYRRLKEYDRKRKTKASKKKSPISNNEDNNQFSPCAQRKAIYRIRKRLPNAPRRYAKVVKGLISCTTPKKRQALKDLGINVKEQELHTHTYFSVKASLFALKGQNTLQARKKRQTLVTSICKHWHAKSKACQELGIRRDYLRKISDIEEESNYRKSNNELHYITDYYMRPEVSVVLPSIHHVAKGQSKHYLQKPLTSVYKEFKEEYPSIKIGKSKFASMRPNHVKPMSKHPLNECVCEYCANIQLQLKPLSRLNKNKESECSMFKDRYSVVRSTMCPKSESFEKRECIEIKCKDCGVHKIEKIRANMLKDESQLQWHEWRLVEREDGKKRMGLVLVNAKPKEFIESFCGRLETMSSHLFVASWQYKQFQHISTNVPDNCLVS